MKWTTLRHIVRQMPSDFILHLVCISSRPGACFLPSLELAYARRVLDNYPQPGKRPLSSIAPVVIEYPDGRLHLVAGGSGGSRIFGSVVQVILGIDWGLDIGAAIEQPRVHNQLFPQYTSIESTFSMNEILALAGKGHIPFGKCAI